MKTFVIINGMNCQIIERETMVKAIETAQNVSDHSKEIIVREIFNGSVVDGAELLKERDELKEKCHGYHGALSETLAEKRRIESLNAELLEALKEARALLDEHEPQWYLRGHFNRFSAAIAKAEGREHGKK
jgi:hypothetical protein